VLRATLVTRALTGTPPFVAGEIAETLYKVVHGKPRRPSLLADVPPEVDLVLAIGMAKDRDRRFASAAELVAGLRAAFAGALPADVFERGRQLGRAGVTSATPAMSGELVLDERSQRIDQLRRTHEANGRCRLAERHVLE
jgi:hypothetical protein